MEKTERQAASAPLKARIMLAHAYFQRVANTNGIDILHVKGYAFGPEVYRPERHSTDVDLLVRPSHVDRFVQALIAQGWSIQAHFETGSVFEHAMTLHHDAWGLTDIHRFFPGLGENHERVFEQLWLARTTRDIAHRPCTVPSVLDARVIVVLHRARAAAKYSSDLKYLNEIMSYSEWERVHDRALELHSGIAYAAAMGHLAAYRGHRDYLLWKAVSTKVPPYLLWFARVRSARGIAEKARVIRNIALVNEDHLAMTLGHKPSRSEIWRQFFSRFGIKIPKGGK